MSNRFCAATTTEYPTDKLAVYQYKGNNNAESISMVTNASAKYLIAYVYISRLDTDITFEELANTIQVVDAPMEQFVSRGEFNAVVPSDTSADNKLVNDDTIADIWKVQGELGVKNLLMFPYELTSVTNAGLTMTANSNGSLHVSGSPTATSILFTLFSWNGKKFTMPSGNFISTMTGIVTDSETKYSKAQFIIFLQNGTTGQIERTLNQGTPFTISKSEGERFQSGALRTTVRVQFTDLTINEAIDVTLFPMICPMVCYATDSDFSWAPFAFTNYQLTRKVETNRNVIKINNADGIEAFYNKMVEAYSAKDCDVYIGKGDYIYTNEFVDSIRSAGLRGIPIGNGCRYYFETGANIICHYTGDNASDVVNYFSPLDTQSRASDFEIYNLKISAKNVVYAVHDEANGDNEFCKHVFKNCYLVLDNSDLGENGNSISKALGGGFGKHEEIVIKDCVFDSTNPISTYGADASYHGANASNFSDVSMIVSGCWFKKQFRCKEISSNPIAPFPRVIYTGNSSADAASMPSQTWDIKAWNNELRSDS
jgi:hypothetical protein